MKLVIFVLILGIIFVITGTVIEEELITTTGMIIDSIGLVGAGVIKELKSE